MQLKGLKKKAEKKAAVMAPGGKAKVLDPPPDFIAARLALWDRLKQACYRGMSFLESVKVYKNL